KPEGTPQYCLGNDTVTFSATYAPVPVTVPQTATFYNTSTLHANFIVNAGGATAQDIKDLSEYVQNKVTEKFGIELKREIILLGKF
ncbi:MAG: hypothetical protein IJM92_11275, partial [Fibrobacter sp.]|nr:hypothetical protein [Fibrobacter sp.]